MLLLIEILTVLAIGGGSDGSRLAVYTKLSLSSPFLLSFSGMYVLCVFVPFFLSFLFLILFSCSRWSFLDVPLIFSCPVLRKRVL